MNRQTIITGIVLIVFSIIFGAFGAHALKELVSDEKLISFETGVRYQMYHGIAFMIIGILEGHYSVSKWGKRILLTGVLLFSVSIYLLSLQETISIQLTFLGPFTPVGGVLMIAGWVILLKNLLGQKT